MMTDTTNHTDSKQASKKPVIRFEGFSGEWEEKCLSEVSDVYDGTHQTPKYTSSGVKFLSVENIKDLESNKYISKEDFERDFKTYPKYGDVLMSRIGDIGTPNVVTLNYPVAYYVTLALFKPFAVQSNYLNYAIESDFVQADLWRRTLHIAFPKKINMNEIKKVRLLLPQCENEQTAIGNFFKQLDENIHLHKRKHKQTEQLKKAMLSKLFPKKGQTQPEIRLDGFSGDWVESNFFDNIQKTIDFRGRTPKKIGLEWSDKGYLALSALNVKDGYIDFDSENYFADEVLYQKWMSGNELQKGQVLFTTEAPMGNVARVPDDRGYILSQRTIAFVVNDLKLTDEFLAILLKSPIVFKKLESLTSGGTAKGVSQKSLATLEVIAPNNIAEQTAIGNFFQQLDDTLALQARKISTLQQLKKAFLQNMFV